MRQFHVEDRGLNFVEPKISAHHMVIISRLHPMLAKDPQALGYGVVAATHESGIARGAEILGWIKTKAATIAHRASLFDLGTKNVFGTDGLSRVFDNR